MGLSNAFQEMSKSTAREFRIVTILNSFVETNILHFSWYILHIFCDYTFPLIYLISLN
jgi:hypothetical protein